MPRVEKKEHVFPLTGGLVDGVGARALGPGQASELDRVELSSGAVEGGSGSVRVTHKQPNNAGLRFGENTNALGESGYVCFGHDAIGLNSLYDNTGLTIDFFIRVDEVPEDGKKACVITKGSHYGTGIWEWEFGIVNGNVFGGSDGDERYQFYFATPNWDSNYVLAPWWEVSAERLFVGVTYRVSLALSAGGYPNSYPLLNMYINGGTTAVETLWFANNFPRYSSEGPICEELRTAECPIYLGGTGADLSGATRESDNTVYSDEGASAALVGVLQDVRVFNDSFAPGDVDDQRQYDNILDFDSHAYKANLVLWARLDEGCDRVVKDSSPYKNHGYMGPSAVVVGKGAVAPGAIFLDGHTSSLQVNFDSSSLLKLMESEALPSYQADGSTSTTQCRFGISVRARLLDGSINKCDRGDGVIGDRGIGVQVLAELRATGFSDNDATAPELLGESLGMLSVTRGEDWAAQAATDPEKQLRGYLMEHRERNASIGETWFNPAGQYTNGGIVAVGETMMFELGADLEFDGNDTNHWSNPPLGVYQQVSGDNPGWELFLNGNYSTQMGRPPNKTGSNDPNWGNGRVAFRIGCAIDRGGTVEPDPFAGSLRESKATAADEIKVMSCPMLVEEVRLWIKPPTRDEVSDQWQTVFTADDVAPDTAGGFCTLEAGSATVTIPVEDGDVDSSDRNKALWIPSDTEEHVQEFEPDQPTQPSPYYITTVTDTPSSDDTFTLSEPYQGSSAAGVKFKSLGCVGAWPVQAASEYRDAEPLAPREDFMLDDHDNGDENLVGRTSLIDLIDDVGPAGTPLKFAVEPPDRTTALSPLLPRWCYGIGTTNDSNPAGLLVQHQNADGIEEVVMLNGPNALAIDLKWRPADSPYKDDPTPGCLELSTPYEEIVVPHHDDFNWELGEKLSTSMWVYPEDIKEKRALWCKAHEANQTELNLMMYVEAGRLKMRTTSGGNGVLLATDAAVVREGEWNYIEATFTAGTPRIFVNGQMFATTMTDIGSGLSSFYASDQDVYIGCPSPVWRNTYKVWKGKICDVRMRKGTTISVPTTHYLAATSRLGATTGTQMLLHLNDNEGVLLAQDSGAGHATLSGELLSDPHKEVAAGLGTCGIGVQPFAISHDKALYISSSGERPTAYIGDQAVPMGMAPPSSRPRVKHSKKAALADSSLADTMTQTPYGKVIRLGGTNYVRIPQTSDMDFAPPNEGETGVGDVDRGYVFEMLYRLDQVSTRTFLCGYHAEESTGGWWVEAVPAGEGASGFYVERVYANPETSSGETRTRINNNILQTGQDNYLYLEDLYYWVSPAINRQVTEDSVTVTVDDMSRTPSSSSTREPIWGTAHDGGDFYVGWCPAMDSDDTLSPMIGELGALAIWIDPAGSNSSPGAWGRTGANRYTSVPGDGGVWAIIDTDYGWASKENVASPTAGKLNLVVRLSDDLDMGDANSSLETAGMGTTTEGGAFIETTDASAAEEGLHRFAVTFYDPDTFMESNPSAYVDFDVDTSASTILSESYFSLGAIPLCGERRDRVYRRIYKTPAGGTTFYLAQEIPDNTTSSAVLTNPDTWLALQATMSVDNDTPAPFSCGDTDGYRVYLGDKQSPIAWYSKSLKPWAVPADNYLYMEGDVGGPPRAIRHLYGQVVVFTATGVFLVSENTGVFRSTRVEVDEGAYSANSVLLSKRSLVRTGKFGIYGFNGTEDVLLSREIAPPRGTYADLDSSWLNGSVQGVFWKSRDKLIWNVKRSADDEPSTRLDLFAPSVGTPTRRYTVTDGDPVYAMATARQVDGSEQLWGSDTYGYVLRLDHGDYEGIDVGLGDIAATTTTGSTAETIICSGANFWSKGDGLRGMYAEVRNSANGTVYRERIYSNTATSITFMDDLPAIPSNGSSVSLGSAERRWATGYLPYGDDHETKSWGMLWFNFDPRPNGLLRLKAWVDFKDSDTIDLGQFQMNDGIASVMLSSSGVPRGKFLKLEFSADHPFTLYDYTIGERRSAGR